ncbi:MAPEG family protein [Seohaeicola saemankumensis]|nr:MAPEG family protein [Seohaeicola saemankumensis]MCA0873972.1 MAPEG family protein [Seohaeicola saemankumensis]
MLFWILCALLLYYVGVFLPSLFLVPRIGVPSYLGSRDSEPEPTVLQARAARATANLQENLATFLTLAILAMVLPQADQAQAVLGAGIFVIARLVYLPLYLLAVPVARSAVWTAGFAGLIVMGLALV